MIQFPVDSICTLAVGIRWYFDSCFKLLIAVGLLTLVSPSQSAIFNIPSTDTQPDKTAYIEADLFSHFGSYRNGGFQIFGPFTVYGLKNNIEIGANLYVSRSSGSTTVELQPNAKWRYYENRKTGIAASVGTLVLVPLNKAAGLRPSVMLYANVSKRIESAKGMRLTGGVYGWAGTQLGFGTKLGVQLGLEQPLSAKTTIMGDWSSGKNRIGYGSLGLGHQVNEKQYIGAGYSLGNYGRGNNYFTVFYGFTL
jgi:hypothetical protein